MGSEASKGMNPVSRTAGVEDTQPPIRLQMVSEGDQVAMEVFWCDDASSEKQRWSSDEDNFCTPWQATKFLPSCATNITVQFHTVSEDKEKAPVSKASRGGEEAKTSDPEVVELRTSPTRFVDNTRGISNSIDAQFTMAGYGSDCYLKSAWNAAGEPRSWEVCDEEGGRPDPAETLPVLAAADGTPMAPPELGHVSCSYVYATRRFVAALKALQEVRREALEELSSIDEGLSVQWWCVNLANSASFCCDTASALTVYPCPPASMITGFCSATLTVTSWSLDTVAEASKSRRLRKLLFWMLWNCVAVQELETKWREAKKLAEDDPVLSKAINEGLLGDHCEILRTIGCNAFCITFDIVSSTCSAVPKCCPAKVPFLMSWFGAVGCFMVMANGWLTTKTMQTTVQEMAVQLQEASKIADEHLEKFVNETEASQKVLYRIQKEG